jgi:DNA-binding MarR family transcriptional regulator
MRTGASDVDDSWETALPHVLWRAQNALHRRLQESIDELGVTVTQLGLAVHLQELGSLSAADLSRGFHIAPQSVGTALTQLEKLGWVARRAHPVHGRVVLFELTAAGVEGVRAGRRRVTSATEGVTSSLSERELQRLVELLRHVSTAVDGPDQPVRALWPA